MQLTWRERKFTGHIWMKTGWEISLFRGGSEDGQWERATLRWVSTVQNVKERTKGLHEEYYGTAGAVGINYNKSISDGDNGIFKNCASNVVMNLSMPMPSKDSKKNDEAFFPYTAY